MEKSKLKSFIKRAVTALILMPVVITLIVIGYPTVSLLLLTGAVLLSWEWSKMVHNSNPVFYALTYFFVPVVFLETQHLIASLTVMLLALSLVFIKSKGEKHRKLLILGIPYITIGVVSIDLIYKAYGPLMLLWYIFVVWGVDIGGYLVGSTVKGPKLAPKISPNKTWSGLIGGVMLSVAICAVIMSIFSVNPSIRIYYLIMAGIIAVIAQIGDLIESSIKRHLKIKDSGNLIPGHGGVFDRIDGLIFAAPFTYLILTNIARIVN